MHQLILLAECILGTYIIVLGSLRFFYQLTTFCLWAMGCPIDQ